MSEPLVLNVGDISLGFPLEIWILIGVAIIYALLLVVVLLRAFCLVFYGNPTYAVHKYREIFAMWALMLIHTTVYAGAVIAIVQLATVPFDASCVATANIASVKEATLAPLIGIGVFTLLAFIMGSTVDVVGSYGKNRGTNCCGLRTIVFSILGIYQINCVWKMSGHLETDGTELKNKYKCLGLCVENRFQPSTKNAKDLVSMQGVVQSVPVLITLLGSYVLLPCGEWSVSVIIALATSAISAVLAIMFVDYDAAKVDYKLEYGRGLFIYMVMSFFKRLVELAGVVLLYTYFLMIQGWYVVILVIVTWILMALTQLDLAEASKYSRVAGWTNKLYLSWGAVFFGFFKRISIDKDFIGKETTMMPAMFELVRYILKIGTFVAAFFVSFMSGNAPKLDTQENFAAAVLTWGALVCYALLIIILLVEFLCFRRKAVKLSDCKLWCEWCKNDTPFKCLCAEEKIVVNKDTGTGLVYA